MIRNNVFLNNILSQNTDLARVGEIRDAYKIQLRKPEGKRPVGRHVDWIHLPQDRNQ
jgi:hypothetical protein